MIPSSREKQDRMSAGTFANAQRYLPYLKQMNDAQFMERIIQHGDKKLGPYRTFISTVLRSITFEWIMASFILMSVVVTVIEVDRSVDMKENRSRDWTWVGFLGGLSLSVFVAELLLRLFAFQMNFFKDPWNIFDLIVVSLDGLISLIGLSYEMMAGSGLPISTLRIFRLAKLARISKVLRVFSQLRLMLSGLLKSITAIFWGAVLLLVCLLVWAMIGVLVIHPVNEKITHPPECERCSRAYSSVADAMLTLWQQVVVGDDWGAITIPLMEKEPITTLFFTGAFFTVGMAVMNLILGVVVEVAQKAKADLEQEEETERILSRLDSETKLIDICKAMDDDGNGTLSREEVFAGFTEPGPFKDMLKALDVRPEDFDVIFALVDTDKSGTVSYKELINYVCKMTTSDIDFLLTYIKYSITLVRDAIDKQTELEQRDHAEELEQQHLVEEEMERLHDEIAHARAASGEHQRLEPAGAVAKGPVPSQPMQQASSHSSSIAAHRAAAARAHQEQEHIEQPQTSSAVEGEQVHKFDEIEGAEATIPEELGAAFNSKPKESSEVRPGESWFPLKTETQRKQPTTLHVQRTTGHMTRSQMVWAGKFRQVNEIVSRTTQELQSAEFDSSAADALVGQEDNMDDLHSFLNSFRYDLGVLHVDLKQRLAVIDRKLAPLQSASYLPNRRPSAYKTPKPMSNGSFEGEHSSMNPPTNLYPVSSYAPLASTSAPDSTPSLGGAGSLLPVSSLSRSSAGKPSSF